MVKHVTMSSQPKTAILRYMCTICSTLVRKTNSETHIKLHTLMGTVKCELCNFKDSHHDSFVQHVKGHLEKRFECPICGDIYISEQAYLDHKSTHPVSMFAQKVHYECCDCGKTYFPAGKSRKSLKEAMQKHQEQHGWLPGGDAHPLVDSSGAAGGLSDDECSNGDDITDGNQDCRNASAMDSSMTEHFKTADFGNGQQLDPTNDAAKQRATKHKKRKNTRIVDGIPTSCNIVKDVKKIRRHSCHLCQESFTRKPDLSRHLRTIHKDITMKKCGQCPETFVSRKNLNIHIKKSHNRITPAAKVKRKFINHVCGVCELIFNSKNDLNVHHKIAHKELIIIHKCVYCARPSFKSRNYLRAHIKKMHRAEWAELKINVEFSTENVRRRPAAEDIESDVIASDKNENAGSENLELVPMEGMQIEPKGDDGDNNETPDIEDPSKPENVEMGPSEDPQTDKLSSNENTNSATPSKGASLDKACDNVNSSSDVPSLCHSCILCDKKYGSKSGLMYHIASVHTGQSELCSLCGDAFKTKVQYRNHMKQHLDDFECVTCKQQFSTMKKLNLHMNQKGCHACEVCGQRFRQRYNLVLHRSIHTGEKPFQCYECGKTFRIKTYLEDHLRVHRGDKQFICLVCQMKFMTVGALRRHSRTHTEERPFMCSQCGKGFKLHPNLNRHMRIHSGERYDCPICHRKVTEKSNLIKHMRIHEKRGQMVLKASQQNTVVEEEDEKEPLPTVKSEDEEEATVNLSVQLAEQSEPVVLTIPVRPSSV